MLALLPESSGLLPKWYKQANETAQGRLRTLALELAKALLPETFTPHEPLAGHVRDLAAALRRAGIAADPAHLSLMVKSAEKTGVLSLIMPAENAQDVFAPATTEEPAPPTSPPKQTRPDEAPPPVGQPRNSNAQHRARTLPHRDVEEGIALLPPYTRSLLKVKVPVTVTLAAAKQTVGRVLELSPGSIIQFDKACDDALTLEVGDQPIAVGEAVKTGDKFGLWITAMTMPGERFCVISRRERNVPAN